MRGGAFSRSREKAPVGVDFSGGRSPRQNRPLTGPARPPVRAAEREGLGVRGTSRPGTKRPGAGGAEE